MFIKIRNKSHFILGILIILWLNAGLISHVTIHINDAIKIIFCFLWFLSACFLKKNYILVFLKENIYIFLFLLVLLLSRFFGENIYSNFYIKTTIFIIFINAIYIYYRKFIFEKKIIILVLLLDYIYIGVNTFLKLVESPNLSRYLSTSEENIIKNLGVNSSYYLGVGNYIYAYSMVVVALYFLYNFFLKEKKIIYILGYVGIFFIILKMHFTISLIFLILLSIKLSLEILCTNKYLINFIKIGILITSIFIYEYIADFLEFISKFFPDGTSTKLKEISSFLIGKHIYNSDLLLRFNLYFQSFKTFCDNIFVGQMSGVGIIGGHSTWFDFFGSFGLLAIFILAFLMKFYKKIINNINLTRISKIYIKNSYLYIFLLGFVNTIYISRIFLIIIIFIPFSIKERRGNNE